MSNKLHYCFGVIGREISGAFMFPLSNKLPLWMILGGKKSLETDRDPSCSNCPPSQVKWTWHWAQGRQGLMTCVNKVAWPSPRVLVQQKHLYRNIHYFLLALYSWSLDQFKMHYHFLLTAVSTLFCDYQTYEIRSVHCSKLELKSYAIIFRKVASKTGNRSSE